MKKKDADKKSDEAKWLTERHLFFALNTIARFKQVATMTAHDYDRYLAEYLGDRKRPAHILGNARFPTSAQIENFASKLPPKDGLNPWNTALILVGLEEVPEATSKSLTTLEAIDLYIEATFCEFYPSMRELPRLRSEFGISIQEKEEDRPFTETIKEALAIRKEKGLPVPTMKAAISTKPKLVLPPGFATPQMQTPKGAWKEKTDEELAATLIPYVLDCQQRAEPVRPTKKDYQSWSVGKRDYPSADTLCSRKNWGEWMRMVDEMLLELKKAA